MPLKALCVVAGVDTLETRKNAFRGKYEPLRAMIKQPTKEKMQESSHTGLWIPKTILERTDMTYIEKIVWSMARALPNGLRMSDATIAEQVGATPRYIGNVLCKMVRAGMLEKRGSYGHRSFYPITPICVIDYTYKCNRLHSEVTSITHISEHKVYENKKKAYTKDSHPVEPVSWESEKPF